MYLSSVGTKSAEQACHLCTFNVAAIFFRGHPYTWRTYHGVLPYAMIGACIAILQDQNQADECIDTACSSLPRAKPPLTHPKKGTSGGWSSSIKAGLH